MDKRFHALIRIPFALTWLYSGLAPAGGGHNSTSPAMGTVQLASILCHLHAASPHQTYSGNSRTLDTTALGKIKKSRLCQQWRQQVPYPGSGRRLVDRKTPREAAPRLRRPARSADDQSPAASTALQHRDSRDRFKQETWFVQKGTHHKRVTKWQARKHRWAGPKAMQAASESSPDPGSAAPAVAAQTPFRPESPALTAARKNDNRITRAVRRRAAMVTPCLACDGVETGLCEVPGTTPAPFKMLRPQGVVAFPRFTPGNDNAEATSDSSPHILVKKFHYTDGAIALDTGFSDDGMEEFPVPLPEGEQVTAFTLSKDKLIVLSRPSDSEGLSRVTSLRLDGTEGPDSVDGRLHPALWVKGELYRYHDETLYTFSPEDNKVFVYPLSTADSPGSGTLAHVIDLSPVRTAGEDLLAVLFADNQATVALRKAAPDQQEPDILVYQLNEYGERLSETPVAAEDWQARWHQADAMEQQPGGPSALDALLCPPPVHSHLREKKQADRPCGASSDYFVCQPQWSRCPGAAGTAEGSCFNPATDENCSIRVVYTGSDPSLSGSIVCPSCPTPLSWQPIAISQPWSENIKTAPACIEAVKDGSCHIPHDVPCEGALWDVCVRGQGIGTCTHQAWGSAARCHVQVSTLCPAGASRCGAIRCQGMESDNSCEAQWHLPGKDPFHDFPKACLSDRLRFHSTAEPGFPSSPVTRDQDLLTTLAVSGTTLTGFFIAVGGCSLLIAVCERCWSRRGYSRLPPSPDARPARREAAPAPRIRPELHSQYTR